MHTHTCHMSRSQGGFWNAVAKPNDLRHSLGEAGYPRIPVLPSPLNSHLAGLAPCIPIDDLKVDPGLVLRTLPLLTTSGDS